MKHLKQLFVFALISLFSVSMWGAEELKATLDFTNAASDWGIPTTATIDADTYTHGDYTISLYGGTVSGKGYKANSGYLLLGQTNATLTLPAFSWTTTKIIVYGNSGASSAVGQNIFVGSTEVSTATTGATSSNTYEIASGYQAAGNVYVLKVTTKHNTQITSIEIYGETSGGTPTCATPTFSPAAGAVLSGTEVTISSSTAGATIYYTTNGDDPTTSSATTQPIVIDAAKTIKAIAVKDGANNSAIATAAYTIATPKTIAQVLSDISTTESDAFLLNDVTVTYANGKNIYVKDASGYILVYDNNSVISGAANGKVLQGLWGKAKTYNGLPEISTITVAPTVSDGTAVDPLALDAYPTDGDLNKYVTLEDVTFAAAGSFSGSVNNVNGTFDGSTLILRNTFKLSGVSVETGKSYRVVGVVQKYNSDYQVYPITITEIVEAGAPEAPTFTPAAGTYTSVQSVEIECATAGATIYYTTNGSTPDNTSTVYSSAITVDANMTIKAIAIKDELSSSIATAAYTINLPPDPETTCTWDLSIVSCDADPTDDLMQWSATYVTMTNEKGSGTKVTNYYPGTSGKSYTSTRFYTNNTLTITPSGKQITTIVFTATSASYATALEGSTWTNATAVAEGSTVTVTATDGESAVSAVIGGTCGFTAVTVNYTNIDPTKPATPTFTPAAGTYTSVQNVEIECATAGATIYYTTDGSTPSSSSTEYSSAITVDATQTIKAIAIKDAKSSSVATAAYTINLPIPDPRNSAVGSTFTTTSGFLTPSDILFISHKGGAGTAPANYNDGIRLYQIGGTNTYGGYVTLIAKKGCKIDEVEITTTNTYATSVGYYVDADEAAISGEEEVAKSGTYNTATGLNADSVRILNLGTGSKGRLEIASITVYYTGDAEAVDHYELGGTYQTEFEVDDAFNHDGVEVYMAFDAGGTEKIDLTAGCTFSEPDMSVAGTPTVEISFGTTVITSYTINVAASTLLEPEISYDPTSVTLTQGDALSAPTLNNPHTLDLTFTSNKSAVATVDEFGVIALAGGTGTAVITASFAGDATYKAGSATFTITVNEPEEDLSGTWEFATSVAAGDRIIIASIADAGAVTTMGGQGSSNRSGVASTVAGTILTPAAGSKSVTLVDAGEGKFALQLHNGKYLYASSNSSNQLKETATYADNENAKWTIAFDGEGVATITAQGANERNLMRYNPNSGSPLFACYASSSTTGTLVTIYKKESVTPTPDYTRTVTVGKIGTLCVPYNVEAGNAQGAVFYQIAGKASGKLEFVEVDALEAGKPYIFQATEDAINLYYGATSVANPVEYKGMVGSFSDTHVDIDDSNKTNIMYIANNKLWDCSDLVGSYLEVVANRAYIFDYENIGAAPAHAPGKRYIVVGKDQATGFDQLDASETPMKLIIDGQLFILRGEKMYNANGQLVK